MLPSTMIYMMNVIPQTCLDLLYIYHTCYLTSCSVFSGVASTSGVQFTIENVLLVVIRAIAVFEGSNKFMNDTGTCFYVSLTVLSIYLCSFYSSTYMLNILNECNIVCMDAFHQLQCPHIIGELTLIFHPIILIFCAIILNYLVI